MSSHQAGVAVSDSPDGAQDAGPLPLLALCLGFFMITMDATVVNTALPDIGRGLRADVSGLQWVLDGYTLVFACLMLSGGSLGDRLGSRQVFLLGVGLFTVASAACGLAPALWALITARVAQGIGAALALPTSLALINASYPDSRRRARAIGVWGGLGGVAAGLGPVLGGILTTWAGWPAIFYVNVPIGVATIALTLRFVVAPAARRREGVDLPGQVLAVCAVAGMAYGLIEAGTAGWTSPWVISAFGLTIVSGTGFVVVEHRRHDPMLPLTLFSRGEFTGSVLIGAAINIGFYGELFLLSLYFQHTRHFSPLRAGLALLPQAGVASVASSLGGRHTARFGARRVMSIGLVVGAAGLFAMTMVTPHTTYGLLIGPLMAIGFGTAYTMPAATAATLDAVPASQAGTASGTLNAGRQIGSTLGVAVFGAFVASGGFMTGYHLSVITGGLVFLAGALVALRIPGPRTAG